MSVNKEAEKEKLSFFVFRDMFVNTKRLSAMVWREKNGVVILMSLVFLIVSAAPFLQSGSRALLINELVNIAGEGTPSPYILLLIGVLILATLIPSMLYAVQNYIQKLFWFFLGEKFDVLVLEKQADIDVAIHEDPQYQNLFNKVREQGIHRVQNFIERQFFIFQNLIEVVIASVILIFSEWWVFLIIFI